MANQGAKWEATVRGRLQTLLGLDADPADFGELETESARRLGAEHSATLLVRCCGQYRRSYRQSAMAAVASWAELRDCAQASLPDSDPTLMAIRSYHARFLALRGRQADLDEAVRLRRDDLELRSAILPADDNMIGVARADLAAALVDWSRISAQAQAGSGATLAGRNLAEAMDLITLEADRRSRIFTPRNSFSQHSNGVLATLYLALAERAPKPQRTELASRSFAITSELIDFYWEQGDARSLNILKSLLHRAESLILLERSGEGVRTARQGYRISYRSHRNFDRGWPAFVLAKALLPMDKSAAREAASQALDLRRQVFPADSCRVLEVERFTEQLR